jgi:hypothetical protein
MIKFKITLGSRGRAAASATGETVRVRKRATKHRAGECERKDRRTHFTEAYLKRFQVAALKTRGDYDGEYLAATLQEVTV